MLSKKDFVQYFPFEHYIELIGHWGMTKMHTKAMEWIKANRLELDVLYMEMKSETERDMDFMFFANQCFYTWYVNQYVNKEIAKEINEMTKSFLFSV